MRVYFGGSFNPPHIGHDQILKALLALDEVTYVHVVPTSQNPLKNELSLGLFTYEQRWTLVETWLNELSAAERARVVLEPIEIDTARAAGYEVPQYTIDSFSEIEKHSPPEPWALALGQDILLGLPRWKDVEKLLPKFQKILIFPRGVDQQIRVPPSLSKLSQFVLLPETIAKVSSTEIRESLDSDGTTASALLPAVRQRILDFKS